MEAITIFTTRGLIKPENEDVLGIRITGQKTLLCLCDGHWGRQAAELACRTLMSGFPTTRNQAVEKLNKIQLRLYCSHPELKPPETSVLAARVNFSDLSLDFTSYGDCRLLLARNNRIIYTLPIIPTWLGPLSYQVVRNRQDVKKALIFENMLLKHGDEIFIFSDGIDECVYDTPTIPNNWIVKHTPSEIIERVVKHGAEDNASLIVIKC